MSAPVGGEDRVADVLERDEGLVDVFAEVSPVFERLRSRAMRRVMARLVTVEQAARVARVDPDVLVARLNAALEPDRRASTGAAAAPDRPAAVADGGESTGPAAGGPAADGPRSAVPEGLRSISGDDVVHLDVREDLRQGREPFRRIMDARREVPEGGALCLRATFEPVPLYAVMAKQGLAHHTERLDEDDWRVWFYAPASAAEGTGAGPGTPDGGASSAATAGPPEPVSPSDDDVEVLDVRGLEPPEPMMRTLEALEALEPGRTLVQINERVPRFLLPRLEERGWTYEVDERRSGVVRLFIRRASAEDAGSGEPIIPNDTRGET